MDVILIKNGVVENVIVADSVERAAEFFPDYILVQRTLQLAHVSLGYTHQNGGFVAPAEWDTTNPDRKVTPYAFLRRFTTEEAVAIDLASMGATVQAAVIRRYLSLINQATWIDLLDPVLREDIDQMVSAGLLTQERATVILDGPISENERP